MKRKFEKKAFNEKSCFMKKVKIKKFQMLLVSKIDKELKVDRAEFI